MYIKKRPDVVRLSLKGVSGFVVVIVAIFIYPSRKFDINKYFINNNSWEYQVKKPKN